MVCIRRAMLCVRGARDAWRCVAGEGLRLGRLRAACAVAGLSLFAGSASVAATEADLWLGEVRPDQGDDGLGKSGVWNARALADYSCALQFEAAGRMREALKHYLRVFQVDPSNADLAAHTAELALRYDGLDRARSILEEAVAANPRKPEPYLHLARFCMTYGPDDPGLQAVASSTLAVALERFPDSGEVYTAVVMMHLTGQKREQAIAVMEKAAEREVPDPEFWLETGRAAQRVWPLGEMGDRQEHLDRVNPFFENALRYATGNDEESSEARLEVARFFLLSNQPERALAICEQLAGRPDGLVARKLLFRLYEARNMEDEALKVLERIVEEVPGDVEQRELLSRKYQQRGEIEKAIPQLESVIQIGGGDANDYLNLGEMLARTQQNDRLIQLTARSIQLFPETPMFRVQAAMAFRAREEWGESLKHFEEAERLATTHQPELLNHRFYFQYGITHEGAGRHEKADRMLEKSITMTPKEDLEGAATAMNYLGYMWLERDHQIDKAGELIMKANELQPNNAAYIDSLGWYHFKKGALPEALAELQRAEKLLGDPAPEDAEILEHIARVLENLGRIPEALDYLRRADALQSPDEEIQKRVREGLDRLAPGAAKPAGEE